MITVIRLARLKKGKTNLRQFADGLGLSYCRLSRVELAQETIPKGWRGKLGKALGLTEKELVDERGLARLAD